MATEGRPNLPDGRSIRIKADVLKKLRIQKGWRVEDLAARAICSPKTIENSEGGKRVMVVTLRKIAKALGVEPGVLVDDGGSPAQEQEQPLGPFIEVSMKLVVPFEQFDETSDLSALLLALIKKLGVMKGDVIVQGVREGSVALDLLFSDRRDVSRLVRLYCSEELEDFGVEELVVRGYEGIASDIAGGLTRLVDAQSRAQRMMLIDLVDRFPGDRDATYEDVVGDRRRGHVRFRVAHQADEDLWLIRLERQGAAKKRRDTR